MEILPQYEGQSNSQPSEVTTTSIVANPVMSRRSFFSLSAAVGALAFLGSVFTPHGMMLSAWADEEQRIHFTIYVLGRDEIPILCFDMENDAKTPVEGMNITIESMNNSETVTAVTNKDGFATAHIRPLSQQANDDTATTYSFFGKVTAQKAGYREFCNPETYICTGVPASADGVHSNALEIPTHSISEDAIYLRTAALDGADVQYCEADCGVGSDNTVNHTFLVEVIAPAETSSIDAKVVLVAPNGTETIWAEETLYSTSDAPTSFSKTFDGVWLKDAVKGSMLKVKFGETGETTYVMSSKVAFVDEVPGLANATGEKKLSPGQDSDKEPDTCPIPSWIINTGDTFTSQLPALPVKIFSDNKANFGIAVTFAQLTFLKRRNGENKLEDADKLKHVFGGQGVQKAWNAYKTEVANSVSTAGNAANDMLARDSVLGRTPFTSKIDASIQAQFQAYFSWKADEETGGHYWTGDAAIVFDFGITASWTKQFFYGIIPFYIVIDLAANLTAKLALGAKFGGEMEGINWHLHSLGKSGLAIVIVIHAEAGVAIAVGVAGIAGLGVRGSGYIHFEFTFDEVKDKACPHIIGKLACKVEAFVQVLFLKKTWVLKETPHATFWDNWDKKKSALEAEMANATFLAAHSASTMDDATVVTEAELAFCADYTASKKTITSDELSAMGVEEDASGESPYVWEYTRIQKKSRDGLYAQGASEPGFESPYDESGNTSYNPLRGLKPTAITRLFEDTYSNSRIKVVHGYSGFVSSSDELEPVVAGRLVTINLEAEDGHLYTVTRVALSVWDYDSCSFGEEQIVEFSVPEIDDIKRFDVDFDFDLAPSPNAADDTVAYIAITSLERPSQETFEEYEKQQFISVTAWHYTQSASWNKTNAVYYNLHSMLEAGYITSHPRVAIQGALRDTTDDSTQYAPFVYYYKTNIDTKETTLNVTSNHFGNSTIVLNDMVAIRTLPDGLTSADFRAGTFEVYTPTRFDAAIEQETEFRSAAVVGWTGCNSSLSAPEGVSDEDSGAPYSFLCTLSEYLPGITIGCTLTLPYISSLTKRSIEDGINAPFVYCDDTSKADQVPYKMIQLNESGTGLTIADAQGATTMNRYFASHDGKWLYTVREVKNEVPGLGEDAQASVDAGAKVYSEIYKNDDNYGDLGDVTTDGGLVKTYQLYEARWHGQMGSYFQFYPIAQLDFCPDNIDIISNRKGRRDFLFTNISAVKTEDTTIRYELDEEYDMDEVYHVADMYQVTIPHALGVHVKDLESLSPYAAAGDSAYLNITLANTGNWFITGFDVDFYGPDDEQIDCIHFTDLENRVQDTKDNYAQVLDESGNVSYDEDGTPLSEKKESVFDGLGVLAPGSTRTYRIEFTVPEGLSGNTDFSLQVRRLRCEAADIRSDWFSDEDYLSKDSPWTPFWPGWLDDDSDLIFIDPNIHGVPSSGYTSAEHTWTFESAGAPYAKEGEDPQPERVYERGDVNGNDKVNIVDAQLAYDIACNVDGMEDLPNYEAMKERADVTGDGLVRAEDAFSIQHAVHNGWE